MRVRGINGSWCELNCLEDTGSTNFTIFQDDDVRMLHLNPGYPYREAPSMIHTANGDVLRYFVRLELNVLSSGPGSDPIGPMYQESCAILPGFSHAGRSFLAWVYIVTYLLPLHRTAQECSTLERRRMVQFDNYQLSRYPCIRSVTSLKVVAPSSVSAIDRMLFPREHKTRVKKLLTNYPREDDLSDDILDLFKKIMLVSGVFMARGEHFANKLGIFTCHTSRESNASRSSTLSRSFVPRNSSGSRWPANTPKSMSYAVHLMR